MRNKTVIRIFLTGIIMLFFIGCAANYTIHLIDEETQTPVPGIPIELKEENGKDRIILNDNKSNTDGQFKIDLKEIPGDSFLISISGDDYFNVNKWINTPKKSSTKEILLERRVTIISGYVLDDSTLSGISNCEITTMPAITKSVSTDEKGKYVIKSNEFAEGVSYTIFASKSPEYIQGTTDITPIINKRQDLEYPIYLQRTANKLGDVELEGKEELKLPMGVGVPIN